MSTSVGKIAAQRNHRTLLELVVKPGNDVCADCKAHAPRWASYNLGIFICVNCASIHRKIGTHITKVKSITLDEWSKEQVEIMKEKGNIKSNALYNPNEARHPPPTNMIDSERDSDLEKFIRSKYEFKRFMDRKSGSASQQRSADARAASARSRSATLMLQSERRTSPGPPLPPKTPENLPPGLRHSATIPSLSPNVPHPARSASQPLPPLTNSEKLSAASPLRQPATTQSTIQKPAGKVWDDLISLQEPSQSSSFPLQYSPAAPITTFPSQLQVPVQQQLVTPGNAPNPFMNLSLGQTHATAPFVASPVSVSTPGAQFPFIVPSAPLSSSALHLGSTNPFNQAFSSAANVNGTFPTSSNPFSSSMTTSAPTTPPVQSIMPLPTGGLMQTQPLGHVPLQTPTPTMSFPSTPFAPASTMTGLAPNPFTPTGAPRQVPLSAGVATNPFSAMQMGQAAFSVPTSQTAANSSQHQQPQLGLTHGFSAWAGQGVQRTF